MDQNERSTLFEFYLQRSLAFDDLEKAEFLDEFARMPTILQHQLIDSFEAEYTQLKTTFTQ